MYLKHLPNVSIGNVHSVYISVEEKSEVLLCVVGTVFKNERKIMGLYRKRTQVLAVFKACSAAQKLDFRTTHILLRFSIADWREPLDQIVLHS